MEFFCIVYSGSTITLARLAKGSPIRQRRRPPPVADEGRSCWGRGQQDASARLCTKQTLGAATRNTLETILRRIFHEKANPCISAGGKHCRVDAGAAGIGSGQRQHGGPAVHHAERDGQQPAGCSERCGHPRCTGPDAGVLLHLPRERGLSGHGGHLVHRPARHFALCTLCPHCGAEWLDERLHRRLFPARQRRDTGGSGHGHPQADGL